MSDIKVLVRVTLHLPVERSFDETEEKALQIIRQGLAHKLAIRDVEMVKMESITN